MVCPHCATDLGSEWRANFCPVCHGALAARGAEGPEHADIGRVADSAEDRWDLSELTPAGGVSERPAPLPGDDGAHPAPRTIPAPALASDGATRAFGTPPRAHGSRADDTEPEAAWLAGRAAPSVAARDGDGPQPEAQGGDAPRDEARTPGSRSSLARSRPVTARALESLCTRFRAERQSLGRIVELATLVANADGTIDDAEMELLHGTLSALLGDNLNEGLVRSLIGSSVEGLAARGTAACVDEIARALVASDAVREGLAVAVAVAYQSDGLSAPERAVISELAAAAGEDAAGLAAVISAVRADFDPAWTAAPR